MEEEINTKFHRYYHTDNRINVFRKLTNFVSKPLNTSITT